MNQASFTPEQEERIKAIMLEALSEFVTKLGKRSKTTLYIIAGIFAAFTIITGGLKSILALFGLGITRQ